MQRADLCSIYLFASESRHASIGTVPPTVTVTVCRHRKDDDVDDVSERYVTLEPLEQHSSWGGGHFYLQETYCICSDYY